MINKNDWILLKEFITEYLKFATDLKSFRFLGLFSRVLLWIFSIGLLTHTYYSEGFMGLVLALALSCSSVVGYLLLESLDSYKELLDEYKKLGDSYNNHIDYHNEMINFLNDNLDQESLSKVINFQKELDRKFGYNRGGN